MPINSKLWLFFLLGLVWLGPSLALAQTAETDRLRAQIDAQNQKIKALEQEIGQYQKSLDSATAQAETLAGELGRIATEAKKLASDIQVTETKIVRSELNIERLGLEIGDKDEAIGDHQISLQAALRELRRLDQNNLLEVLLSERDLADFLAAANRLGQLQGKINETIAGLRD